MTNLSLDFESASELDLRKVGLSRYARHPSTRALMLGWAIDGDPVDLVCFAEGQKAPKILKEALRDPHVIKRAWNAPFERAIFKFVLGLDIPIEQWRDTMVLAYSLSFPGKLEKVGDIIDLPDDQKKIARGKLLIRRFCKPRKATKNKPWTWCNHETDPEEWEEFKGYCMNDVEAERAIYRRIHKWDMPEHEWENWFLDQRINEAGIPVNMRVVKNAIKVAREITRSKLDRMAEITGLKNPNSGAQLLPWLRDQGYPFEDLKKGHVARALQMIEQNEGIGQLDEGPGFEAPEELREVLELRQEVSKSSVKKYNALALACDVEPGSHIGFLRNAFQFAGAGRTWRWAGRKYQAQNLARPAKALKKTQGQAVRDLEVLDAEAIQLIYPKPMDLLSTCVRPVVQAPPGWVFIDSDLNAIENRVLGWMADEQKILDVFRAGRCPYVDFAAYMFMQKYDALWAEYKGGDDTKRTTAKPAVLGCGYRLGPGEQYENALTGEMEANGLLGYAWNMGVMLTPEESARSVEVWRNTYSRAVEYWDELEAAAKRCINTGRAAEAGPLRFDRSGPFMRMILPSGRALHYCRPKIEPKRTPWGAIKPTITYEGLNDKKQWVRIKTHSGKITENGDQAIARDLLAHGMRLAAREGLDIRLHVHDQIVAMVREDDADAALKLLSQCMSDQPAWAKGLPLGSAGFVSPFFIKD